jgi:hypothetical protein
MQSAPDQAGDKRNTAGDQRDKDRKIHPDVRDAGTKTKKHVNADSHHGQKRNTRIVAGDEAGKAGVR